ncbi:MAG: ribosomal protein S18-alanine N-acetyltransferase [Fervidicoccaceae archaeon]
MVSVSFRRAEYRDVPKLVEIEERCFGRSEAYGSSQLSALLRCAFLFEVAEVEGEVVGYAVGLLEEGRLAHLISVAVDPAHRRRGIGRALVRRFIEEAERSGAEIAYLEVSERNRAAMSLYSSLGFEVVGKIPKYYSDGSDAYVMALSLRRGEPER